jgi:hypothetical protein
MIVGWTSFLSEANFSSAYKEKIVRFVEGESHPGSTLQCEQDSSMVD